MSDNDQGGKGQSRFLGSLRDALKAASRDEDGRVAIAGENPTEKPVIGANTEGTPPDDVTSTNR